MKEIIAIIRPNRVSHTKDALVELGFPGMTAEPVLGRGKQRGLLGEINCEINPDRLRPENAGGMKYVPKRLLSVVVPDNDAGQVVETIIRVNQTGQIGDGKIFVLGVEEAVRVRTGEQGEAAIL